MGGVYGDEKEWLFAFDGVLVASTRACLFDGKLLKGPFVPTVRLLCDRMETSILSNRPRTLDFEYLSCLLSLRVVP